MFNVGPVFYANYNSVSDIVINQGGTDSGKTYGIIQLLYTIATTTYPPHGQEPIITILSESVPNAKKGAYRIAQTIYNTNEALKNFVTDWNDTNRTILFVSGWIMEFVGATDEQNAKQGKRQYLFVNEANGISYPIFWQYAKRTRIRTWIDYNPSAPFWPHEKLIATTPDGNDLFATIQLIISDHRHNPFLSAREHEKTENIKDKDLWWVYARVKTGNLHGLIYPNWKMITNDKFPWLDDGKFAGQDFGYTNDPSAGVRMVRIGNNIYVHELMYNEGISATKIKAIYVAEGFTSDDPIYCEHDPDMIRQLRLAEVLAIAARKGPGSIKAGISKVNEYNIFYTESSKNIDYERKKYMWISDPDTGKPTNTPSDFNNHLMDAIRYGVYTHYYRAMEG